ncbi:hypothetical protein ABIE45_003834 [Methylobacterium sp. OAE515]|uniref:hypothetical protein n=1 Tax=Methylobacterium sp. OAE515 TaxID=2817895 RepID=UPI001789910C
MKPVTASLACVTVILVLSIVLALVLISVLDAELRRSTARKTVANDNERASAPRPQRRAG